MRTKEEESEIVAQYQAGIKVLELQKRFSISTKALYTCLRAHGVEARSKGLPDSCLEEFKEDWQTMRMVHLTAKYKVTKAIAKGFAKRHNLERPAHLTGRPVPSPETEQAIIDAYKGGKTRKEIAEMFGVTLNILTHIIYNKHNLKMSPEMAAQHRREGCLKSLGVENPFLKEGFHAQVRKDFKERYGVESPLQVEEFKAKAVATSMANFGVANPSQAPEVRDKVKATCMEKYGVGHVAQTKEVRTRISKANSSKEVRAKVEATCMEKYGVPHVMQVDAVKSKVSTALRTEEVQTKQAATCMERFGVANASQSPEIRAKVVEAHTAKYGVPHPMQSPEVKAKSVATFTEKYGVSNAMQSPEVQAKVIAAYMKKFGVKHPMKTPEVQAKVVATTLERFGVPYAAQSPEIQAKIVDTCMSRYGTPHPPRKYGQAEQEVRDWVETLTGKLFPSDRTVLKGKEIDLYNKELKVGIEFCGLFWHTEDSLQPRLRRYHQDKFKACLAEGVRLITIYEDEWYLRQDQVKNFLRSVLNCNTRRFHGRKCEVASIEKSVGRAFIEAHHIQGAPGLGIHFAGLFHGDELLAVMSFGRHHRKTDVLVLDRLCFKDDVVVSGGASKLFKFLLKESGASTILSWSDNRYSLGKVYEALGFVAERHLDPDYSYVCFDTFTRVSKQSQQKSATGCPPEVTEKEFANAQNLHRLWDCGKIAWAYTA